MIRIKLTTPNPDFPLIRQTKNSDGKWGNYIFYINQNIEECDYWVVYDNLNVSEKTRCPKENIILITGEPPSVKKYSNNFIKQFHTIITCHKDIIHNNVIYKQQSLPWMVGAKFLKNENRWNSNTYMGFNDFIENDVKYKSKEISIIVSNKTVTDGHEQRVRFVNKLKETFGDRIDIFGRGYNEIEDKYTAIADYKYTIVLENSSFPDYWTEKIADSFLCGTYPIYYGCTNIMEYFPKGALSLIDITNPEEAIGIIKSVIESNEYEKSIELIGEARRLILNRYNLFPMIINVIENLDKKDVLNKNRKLVKIYPERRFRKALRKVVNTLFLNK